MAKNAISWLVQDTRGTCAWLRACVLFLLPAFTVPAHASLPPIRISAETIELGPYKVSGAALELRDGGITVAIESLRSTEQADLSLQDLHLYCGSLDFQAPATCAGGSWAMDLTESSAQEAIPLAGSIASLTSTSGERLLRSSVSSGAFSGDATVQVGDGQYSAVLTWAGQAVSSMPARNSLSPELHWVRSGTTAGSLTALIPREGNVQLKLSATASGLAFDSPDGRFAGEGLDLQFAADVRPGASLHAEFAASALAGDLLIDNFYTTFSSPGVHLQGSLLLDGTEARIENFQVHDEHSLKLAANLVFNTSDPLGSLAYRVDQFELNFPEAYSRYLESMAAAWALDGLTVTGRLLWSGAGQGGGQAGATTAGILDLADLTVVDTRRHRFAITGLDAHVLPGDAGIESRFSWKGLLLHQINLGAGKAGINATPGQFSLTSPLQLDVLGGRLELEKLQVVLPGKTTDTVAEPEIRMVATLENLEMEQLAQALDWPPFSGTISGRIPGVKMNSGVLEVEGEIEFKVFDGQVRLSGVRLERPFGVLPSLAADLDVENLDLQQVTHTFSFGQISGRMSGFVHDLRMLDWEPVAFDAWFGTPEEAKESNKISRRAVNQLTTIGGGSSTAALTGPLLKLFSNFSYRRLGLGCRLQNYICEVRGLDDDEASVLIMEGAGVPKIMIRVFNRSMDWPTLIAGLTAAAHGEEIRVGDKN